MAGWSKGSKFLRALGATLLEATSFFIFLFWENTFRSLSAFSSYRCRNNAELIMEFKGDHFTSYAYVILR